MVDPVGGYYSDYEILVVVNHDEPADTTSYWAGAEDHLLREFEIAQRIRTPVNLIVHSLSDVNGKLKRGRPFFVDIVRDGIALYEAPDHPSDHLKPLLAADAKAEAQGYLNEWLPGADNFGILAKQAQHAGIVKEAAFLLHQATERLYHCTLLVLTLYSPKSHKLLFLRSQAERLVPSLITAWPRDTGSRNDRSNCCGAPMSMRAIRRTTRLPTRNSPAGRACRDPATAGRRRL
ncbi:hypothetical protein M9979_14885 [Sphingomonas sp. RP10(2022)]|uniref:HEPN domain-containing protein n=1 Tax=Sphingomonas liriopis TaxID=2949094 RepID=A0A9X2HZ78_9SPHN|nr:hypothetical protein [Sphingomonas liriopis]MCP3736159.1 hypothetical protein [Sphingomonas liriopis]